MNYSTEEYIYFCDRIKSSKISFYELSSFQYRTLTKLRVDITIEQDNCLRE